MPDVSKDFKIDDDNLLRGAGVLRALNHKLRQQLLQNIHKKGRVSVTELYVKLRIEQSVASQHLAILRRAHVVNTERDGKTIYYSVNYARLAEIDKLVKAILHH